MNALASDTDGPEEPKHPAEVIAEHRELFETVAQEAEDDEVAELFGQQPLDYLDEHREEVDDA